MTICSNKFNSHKKSVLLLLAVILFVCNSAQGADHHDFAERVITSAKIYTVNPEQPWAEAVAIKDGRIVYVGDNSGIKKWVGPKTDELNLNGKLVLPGIIDSHIHPGLVAGAAELVVMPFTEVYPLAYTGRKEVLEWLKKYAAKNPKLPAIVAGSWRQEDFGAEGPNKKDLDAIVSDRPVILLERWGHGCWMNSKALAVAGVTRNTPDPVPGLAYYQRDKNGEPTGWAKEGAGWDALFNSVNLTEKTEKMLSILLDYLSAHGVTTLFDAGNMTMPDKVYSLISKLDREEKLNIRIEGCYHIILPKQIDGAIAELKRLRSTYSGKNLRFNIMKIHFDGLHTNNTGALMEPYTNKPDARGNTLFSEDRMVDFIVELNKEKIDLHVHCWGDRSAHIMLNAYERAKQKIGDQLYTRLTLTHLPLLKDDDMPRFKQLGVVANFTPGWNGDVSIDFFDPYYGDRAKKIFRVKPLLEDNAPVAFCSDIISAFWISWANPFYAMQVGHNRQAVQGGKDAPVLQPISERLSLEELVRGYTLSGAYQLRMDDTLGSIQVGKAADFVVMQENLFEADRYDIHNVKVDMTIMAGKTVYKRNLIAVLKEKIFDLYRTYFIWSNS
jgi:hypothetical protein